MTQGLERFISAQNTGNPTTHERALAELRAGRKSGHWIWFVLAQLQGLGSSAMAHGYGSIGLHKTAPFYRIYCCL
jgi:uncharacterized protein (DUF1810 family)